MNLSRRIVLKFWSLVLCGVCALGSLKGQQAADWHPSPGHTEIPIWPENKIPDAKPAPGPETDASTAKDDLVAGRTLVRLANVATPTMTVYPPKGENNGAALVVFPGGGYHILAIDLEGSEVCDWANSIGITCILLKYRVPDSGPYPKSPAALEDAQRTLGLVRSHAAEWHIDPHRVGVAGFSAGAHLEAALSTHFEKRIYPPVDAADELSCRPDFAVVIYPAYTARADRPYEPNPDLPVTTQTPPTFLVQTEDDRAAHVESSLSYYIALKNAGVPVEMHLFTIGVHGYGLRHTDLPVTDWPRLAELWLHTIHILKD